MKSSASVDDFNVNFMPNFTVYRSITLHTLRDGNSKTYHTTANTNGIDLLSVRFLQFRCNSNGIRFEQNSLRRRANERYGSIYKKRALYCAW